MPADDALLAALRDRDRQALATVVGRYGPMLTRAAWLYLADAHAAEDAVQETFLAAWDAAKGDAARTAIRAKAGAVRGRRVILPP